MTSDHPQQAVEDADAPQGCRDSQRRQNDRDAGDNQPFAADAQQFERRGDERDLCEHRQRQHGRHVILRSEARVAILQKPREREPEHQPADDTKQIDLRRDSD